MLRAPTKFSAAWISLAVLVVVASGLRLFSVSQSPPGFYIDEAAISAQVICLKQSGMTLSGERWPLFTPVLGGGFLTPPYLAPAVLWTGLFGDSISSFRTLPAFFSILFILGSFIFGFRFWRTPEAAWLCALSAAISPWAFQFARIAWDPSLAPTYLVWAFAFLWSQSRLKNLELILSGVCFAAAAYCYPPLRIQIAVMLPFAAAVLFHRKTKHDDSKINTSEIWQIVLVFVTAALFTLPLILKTASGEIQGRFQMLSIFNPAYLQSQFGEVTLLKALQALMQNFGLLLSPSYLFFHGDANLRHSTGVFGLWSWLDTLGVFVGLLMLIFIIAGKADLKVRKVEIAFIVVGYLAGLLPAALTWESNPHALRSFGAVVFLVLGVGGSLSLMWRSSAFARGAILALAFASFYAFTTVYFVQYPKLAAVWFDHTVVETAARLKAENRLIDLQDELRKQGVDYAPMAISYYELEGGARRCPIAK